MEPTVVQSQSLEMHVNIESLVYGVDVGGPAFATRAEAVNIFRQIRVESRIGVASHCVARDDHLLASQAGDILKYRASHSGEASPDGVLFNICRTDGGGFQWKTKQIKVEVVPAITGIAGSESRESEVVSLDNRGDNVNGTCLHDIGILMKCNPIVDGDADFLRQCIDLHTSNDEISGL